MALQLNIYGQVYNDEEPCFLRSVGGVFVYNRAGRNWVNLASLMEKAEAEGYVFGPREIGVPSAAWQAVHSSLAGIAWAEMIEPTSCEPEIIKAVKKKKKKLKGD